jgi:DNA-directed RNA polymerase subunit RPC12/RpoP
MGQGRAAIPPAGHDGAKRRRRAPRRCRQDHRRPAGRQGSPQLGCRCGKPARQERTRHGARCSDQSSKRLAKGLQKASKRLAICYTCGAGLSISPVGEARKGQRQDDSGDERRVSMGENGQQSHAGSGREGRGKARRTSRRTGLQGSDTCHACGKAHGAPHRKGFQEGVPRSRHPWHRC